MLTKNEVNVLNLSPTKKDFVQIWNELLDVAGKLSERWDPTSTNESDPGIVILKALTGIADKLNYNIDKNTLEAFMPTAAQEDSMRKLCEMLGYNIKYYRSAIANVTFKYYNADPTDTELAAITNGLLIPKFTVVTNSDQDIRYFTINPYPILINAAQPSATISCMQGQIVKCESINDNNIITINQITENNRFYLPETNIAENGIFIYNVCYSNVGICDDGEQWIKVDNLNTQARLSKVFKFGFDSYEGRPYVEFPDDYSSLFKDGIIIYYTRTNGVNGNISAHTLTQLELPNTAGWDQVAAESFSVDNTFSSDNSGANIETIEQAYNGFKKTIGTFDTLVTCRDYMNAIYNMVSGGKNIVSNALVTDIRNDINRAITICSCDDSGILYKEKPQIIVESSQNSSSELFTNLATKPVFIEADQSWHLGDQDGLVLTGTDFIQETAGQNNYYADKEQFVATKRGGVIESDTFWVITQDDNKFLTNIKCKSAQFGKQTKTKKINYFDLVLYPFKSYKQIKNNTNNIKSVYDESFKLVNNSTFKAISQSLKDSDIKTIAHNIVGPEEGDLVSINNYLRLNATIATTSKITTEESLFIIDNIKKALANAFNLHELDFGEEIPFDKIVEVIENADTKIKVVSLNEPSLYTTFSVIDKISASGVPEITEYAVQSKWLSEETAKDTKLSDKFYKKVYKKDQDGKNTVEIVSSFNTAEAKKIYNKLAVRNILAGRVPLFNYSNAFKSSFFESPVYRFSSIEGTDSNIPQAMKEVNDTNNDYIIWADDDGTIYTKQKLKPDKFSYHKMQLPESLVNGQTNDTSNPSEDFVNAPNNSTNGEIVDNVISEDAKGNPITDIDSFCNIYSNPDGTFTDITLEDGEYIKFRAPNLRTTKTYPAYVNYNLQLNSELTPDGGAKPASADSLFNLLDDDDKKQAVLNYFKNIDTTRGTQYVKKFTILQKISKYTPAAADASDQCPGSTRGDKLHEVDPSTGKCKFCNERVVSVVQQGPISITVNNTANNTNFDNYLNNLFIHSGFVKLLNEDFKANLAWDTSDGDTSPGGDVPLEIKLNLEGLNSSFITDSTIVNKIQAAVDETIELSRNNVKSETDPTPILPTACAWTVSFDFECVPFDQESLSEWINFIKLSGKSAQNSLFDFDPIEETGTILWRIGDQGYDIGKYVLSNSSKLLKFFRAYFSTLENITSGNILQNLYLVESLGANASPNLITNNKEYQLKEGERLYIEYTPSSTTEEGTQKSVEAKKEILEAGTIIKPSGFNLGLVDSDIYSGMGNSSFKTVTFERNGKNEEIAMYRLSASEQIEVRELSKVELSQDTLVSSTTSAESPRTINIYKNFNGCSILESRNSKDSDGLRKYTLKDGEYIFYTDKSKTDFAYFGSGTEVILDGNVVIDEYDAVDLEAILESPSEIPWRELTLGSNNDKIIFQEFQYFTLGAKDTLKNLTLLQESDNNENVLDDALILDNIWRYCLGDISYQLHDAESAASLPSIELSGRKGNGWEVCSMLELSSSPNNSQTLRYIPNKINTGLILTSEDSGGDTPSRSIFSPKTFLGAESDSILKFKTNLACGIGSNHVNIKDLITNRNGIKNFKLKVFSTDAPTIVRTKPNKVVPTSTEIFLPEWSGEAITPKDSTDTWYQVDLSKIQVGNKYDNALVIPVLLTPKTYGIASFYLNYTSQEIENSTWIELIPGTSKDAISVINNRTNHWETADIKTGDSDRLYLNPGINCIRFNKSGKFFIKTLSTSQGNLYFDDLKLVSCDTITYTINNGKTKKEALTKGLNLNQIGYLNASGESSYINEEVLSELVKSLVTDFKAKILSLKSDAQQKFNDNSKPFIKSLETIKLLEEDLNNLSILDEKASNEVSSKYAKLKSTYANIKATLDLETDLLKAIEDNNADAQILSYISQLAPKEISQEQLSKALEQIRTVITGKVQGRLPEQTITSFQQNLSSSKLDCRAAATKAFSEIIDILMQNNTETFISALNELATSLESILNGDELTRIQAILESLQESLVKEQEGELQSLLNRLLESSSLNDIYTQLEEMKDALASEDYTKLSNLATNIKQSIISKETQSILTELENAVSESNKPLALKLISLFEDDAPETSLQSFFKYIEDYTDAIISQASELTELTKELSDLLADPDATTNDINVKKIDIEDKRRLLAVNIDKVSNKINIFYSDQLNGLFEEVKNQLESDVVADSNFKNLAEFIKSLQTNNDEQLIAALNKAQTAKDYYDSRKELLETFNIENNKTWVKVQEYNILEEFKSEVVNVWPSHLIALIEQKLSPIEVVIANAIATDDLPALLEQPQANKITIDSIKYKCNNDYYNNFIALDQSVLAKDQLDALIDAIKTLCITEQKNTVITSTATALSDIMGISRVFSDSEKNKFTALTNDDAKDRTRLIVTLLEDLNSDSLTQVQKAQILDNLKKELYTAKNLDSQVLSMIEAYLIPQTLMVKKAFNENSIEYNMASVIESDMLKNISDNSLSIDVLKDYLNTIKTTFSYLREVDIVKDDLEQYLHSVKRDDAFTSFILITKDNCNILEAIYQDFLLVKQANLINKSDLFESNEIETLRDSIQNLILNYITVESISSQLTELDTDLESLNNKAVSVSDEDSAINLNVLDLENKLMREILDTDIDRDFYYTAIPDNNAVIDIDSCAEGEQTLLNPLLNYDINNVNNSFVTSKLDIAYLDTGIKLARSSKISY